MFFKKKKSDDVVSDAQSLFIQSQRFPVEKALESATAIDFRLEEDLRLIPDPRQMGREERVENDGLSLLERLESTASQELGDVPALVVQTIATDWLVAPLPSEGLLLPEPAPSDVEEALEPRASMEIVAEEPLILPPLLDPGEPESLTPSGEERYAHDVADDLKEPMAPLRPESETTEIAVDVLPEPLPTETADIAEPSRLEETFDEHEQIISEIFERPEMPVLIVSPEESRLEPEAAMVAPVADPAVPFWKKLFSRTKPSSTPAKTPTINIDALLPLQEEPSTSSDWRTSSPHKPNFMGPLPHTHWVMDVLNSQEADALNRPPLQAECVEASEVLDVIGIPEVPEQLEESLLLAVPIVLEPEARALEETPEAFEALAVPEVEASEQPEELPLLAVPIALEPETRVLEETPEAFEALAVPEVEAPEQPEESRLLDVPIALEPETRALEEMPEACEALAVPGMEAPEQPEELPLLDVPIASEPETRELEETPALVAEEAGASPLLHDAIESAPLRGDAPVIPQPASTVSLKERLLQIWQRMRPSQPVSPEAALDLPQASEPPIETRTSMEETGVPRDQGHVTLEAETSEAVSSVSGLGLPVLEEEKALPDVLLSPAETDGDTVPVAHIDNLLVAAHATTQDDFLQKELAEIGPLDLGKDTFLDGWLTPKEPSEPALEETALPEAPVADDTASSILPAMPPIPVSTDEEQAEPPVLPSKPDGEPLLEERAASEEHVVSETAVDVGLPMPSTNEAAFSHFVSNMLEDAKHEALADSETEADPGMLTPVDLAHPDAAEDDGEPSVFAVSDDVAETFAEALPLPWELAPTEPDAASSWSAREIPVLEAMPAVETEEFPVAELVGPEITVLFPEEPCSEEPSKLSEASLPVMEAVPLVLGPGPLPVPELKAPEKAEPVVEAPLPTPETLNDVPLALPELPIAPLEAIEPSETMELPPSVSEVEPLPVLPLVEEAVEDAGPTQIPVLQPTESVRVKHAVPLGFLPHETRIIKPFETLSKPVASASKVTVSLFSTPPQETVAMPLSEPEILVIQPPPAVVSPMPVLSEPQPLPAPVAMMPFELSDMSVIEDVDVFSLPADYVPEDPERVQPLEQDALVSHRVLPEILAGEAIVAAIPPTATPPEQMAPVTSEEPLALSHMMDTIEITPFEFDFTMEDAEPGLETWMPEPLATGPSIEMPSVLPPEPPEPSLPSETSVPAGLDFDAAPAVGYMAQEPSPAPDSMSPVYFSQFDFSDRLDAPMNAEDAIDILAIAPLTDEFQVMVIAVDGMYALMVDNNAQSALLKSFETSPFVQSNQFMVTQEAVIGHKTMFIVQVGDWQGIVTLESDEAKLQAEL